MARISYAQKMGWVKDEDVVIPGKKAKKEKRFISIFTGEPTNLYPETELQIACVKHYDQRIRVDALLRHFTRLYAVGAAEGDIPVYLRDLMKRMGKRKGPFDLHFMDKRQKFQYTWIECKWGKNGYTDEQQDFSEWLSDTPIRCMQVRSLNEFAALIHRGT